MQPFSAEHIIPRSKKGATRLDNLAWACQGCNNHKYNRVSARDPVTGAIIALFHPRKQRWEDHFTWNEERVRILGVSPTGRATVAALHLNRLGLVNLRRALVVVREHPPTLG